MGRDAGDDVTHAKISRPAVTTESLAVLSSVAIEQSTRLSVFNQNQYKRLLFGSRVDPLKALQKLDSNIHRKSNARSFSMHRSKLF